MELATKIILKICRKSHLDGERICNLLAELRANEPPSFKVLNPAKLSLRTRQKQKKKWGKILPIGLALKFLTP